MVDSQIHYKGLFIIGINLETMQDILKTINYMAHGTLKQNSNLDIMEQAMHYSIDQLFGFGIILEINGNGIQQ
jgi:hypothetical protein